MGVPMENLIYTSQSNRNCGYLQPRRDQANPRLKGLDLSSFRSLAFRKKQYGPIVANQFSQVAQRFARASFGLGNRKRIEEQCDQPIQEAIPKPFIARVAVRREVTSKYSFHIAGATRHRYRAGKAERINGVSR